MTYPSSNPKHRHADFIVHSVGLLLTLVGGFVLLKRSFEAGPALMTFAIALYAFGALASNLASQAYHFSPRHDLRPSLRRVDHAAIYLILCGTFSPFLVAANTTLTLTLCLLCWVFAAFGVWLKLFHPTVQPRWSTAAYLGLGLFALIGLPDVFARSTFAGYCIIAGYVCYAIGTAVYSRKSLPYRYAIWHVWALAGGVCMFVGVWNLTSPSL